MKTRMATSVDAIAAAITFETTTATAATSAEKTTSGDFSLSRILISPAMGRAALA